MIRILCFVERSENNEGRGILKTVRDENLEKYCLDYIGDS